MDQFELRRRIRETSLTFLLGNCCNQDRITFLKFLLYSDELQAKLLVKIQKDLRQLSFNFKLFLAAESLYLEQKNGTAS